VLAFFNEIGAFLKENAEHTELNPFLQPLGQGLDHLQKATMWFMQNAMAKPDNAGAGSTDYMHLFGLVALGYMWARIAKAALERRSASTNGAAEFFDRRLVLGRVFMERAMPESAAHLARISAGADTLMALPGEMF
jgi:hypothetical protein